MAFVLTNGSRYITVSSTGKIGKTTNIEEADVFPSINKAIEVINRAKKKTTNYHVYDMETKRICWKNNKKKKKRKQYSQEVRELIYRQADGYCQLCGKKLTYNQATLDHIIPLAMGGSNSVDNLQLSCIQCNRLKGSILPETFVNRITDIFIFQMEKKHGKSLKWKIAHSLLLKIL